MTGMIISDFMDKIYCGDEVEFKINETTYFVQGYKEKDDYILTVDYWNSVDGNVPQHDYLFSIKCSSPEERKKSFEEAKIFNGKTIYEIESKIEVIYG